MPEENPNYTWTLRLGTKLTVTRDIAMAELEALLKTPVHNQEVVRQGLRAYLVGAFENGLIINKERMMKDVEAQFDEQWDEMVQAHNKKMRRTYSDGKM